MRPLEKWVTVLFTQLLGSKLFTEECLAWWNFLYSVIKLINNVNDFEGKLYTQNFYNCICSSKERVKCKNIFDNWSGYYKYELWYCIVK